MSTTPANPEAVAEPIAATIAQTTPDTPAVAAGEVAAEAAETTAGAVRAGRYLRMNLSLGFLAAVALVASLYLARAFFVPLLIGILTSYTLRSVVDWLERWKLPRPVGAALALFTLAGSLCWVGYALGDDAAAMIERLPEAARKLRTALSNSGTNERKTPLQNMQEAAEEIQGAASDASKAPGQTSGKGAVVVAVPETSAWLRDYALAQSGLLISVAAQAPMVLLLAYFLLASGVHFRRKLVQLVGPSLSRKKDVIRILEEIDSQVQRYLLVTLVSNTLVGLGTWLCYEALGMESAGVWGVAAGVLHFIPYLGSAVIILGSAVAAFLQSGSILHALVVAGTAVFVSAMIGLVFMTWLQSRAAKVNAAVLFIALLFLGWLWGVWGLLLGAPVLAIVKVVCDRVDALKPVGDLLGR